ncbi:hypothetical protein Tco_1402955 [Tanacetum coccineum]
MQIFSLCKQTQYDRCLCGEDAQNAVFLSKSSIFSMDDQVNYSLLVDPDLIGPWLQQFWATASLRVINDVPHIRAMVAGKKILISEETIRAGDYSLMMTHCVDCFLSKIIWDVLRDIGYEGQTQEPVKGVAPVQWSNITPFWVEVSTVRSTRTKGKKQKKKMIFSQIGENKEEGECGASNCKGGDNIELDLETFQSTARQSTITPRTLNFYDEAAFLGPIYNLNLKTQKPSQATDPKDKGKGILVEEPKKKKLTLQQIRALETTNDEEVAKKIQAEWDAEEEREKVGRKLKKAKPKTTFLSRIEIRFDEIRNYLRIVDFEKSAQDKESLEGISMITELQVIDSPDGQYLIIHRANNHFRAFDTLWEILHILDRQDLQHLYRVVQSYFEHIPPTGLGLILLGDLTTIWETPETSDDDFWKNQEDWEIIRWRLNESSGVHTLELEDGTMIHMLAERRYPLSRELMIRMLDHGMEVEDESEIAITLIHLFILWTTEDGDNP